MEQYFKYLQGKENTLTENRKMVTNMGLVVAGYLTGVNLAASAVKKNSEEVAARSFSKLGPVVVWVK